MSSAHDDLAHASPAGAVPTPGYPDKEVAVGAIAGIVAGAVMWLAAMVYASMDPAALGFFGPLKLVAATFLGPEALAPALSPAVFLVGSALIVLVSVLFGLVFTSMLGREAEMPTALVGGAVFGIVIGALMWSFVVRVVDPLLFQSGHGLSMIAMHGLYGLLLGGLVPFVRRLAA
jgi:hypothetical protein